MQILSQNLLSCLAYIPYIYNINYKFTTYMSWWYYDNCVSWCYKNYSQHSRVYFCPWETTGVESCVCGQVRKTRSLRSELEKKCI